MIFFLSIFFFKKLFPNKAEITVMHKIRKNNYLVRQLSDRVIFEVGETAPEAEIVEFCWLETSWSTDGFDEMRLALSRRSDNSSTEVKWADRRWYIEGSFLGHWYARMLSTEEKVGDVAVHEMNFWIALA